MLKPFVFPGIRSFSGYVLAPLLFVYIAFFSGIDPSHPQVRYTLATAVLMAVWWITEVIPLAATAMLPVVLFPVFGIMNGKEVSATYFNHVIFLFLGGFLVALAMQRWNLHRRIAVRILMLTGTSPAKILLGFMLATAFLSMWISNTATAMLMVPILLSIVKNLEEHVDSQALRKYTTGLLLGVAYGASIGGIATLVGTPPNLSFSRIFQIMFPAAPEIGFSSWFLFAFPLSLIFFIFVWWYLYTIYKPGKSWKGKLAGVSFAQQYKKLGPATYEEKLVFTVFTVLALLWLFRADISIGSWTIKGWSRWFNYPEYLNDGTVAIAMALILFLVPSKQEKGKKILDWETASRLPWNIVLLFGGGFALANGFKVSGLSLWFGEHLAALNGLPPILIIFFIALGITFLTELTSNTATVEMLLPVIASMSVSLNVNPLLFMLPATLSASMAFMLPVATPPNAIVFGSNKITVSDMARTGLVLNIAGAVIITLLTYYWGSIVFDIDLTRMPGWATQLH